MTNANLEQELNELLADLRDLAGALATTAPVRCRQLLTLTTSVERHFQHLYRCQAASRSRPNALERAHADEAVMKRLAEGNEQALNSEWERRTAVR